MKITQTEARRYRADANKLRAKLRQQYRAWSQDFPDGICIGSVTVDAATIAKVKTAITLHHAVVVTVYGDMLYFNAMPESKEQSP